jgi:hypothetical protein
MKVPLWHAFAITIGAVGFVLLPQKMLALIKIAPRER